MNNTTDIVISAHGMLSPLGIGREEAQAAWNEGESACFPSTRTPVPEGCRDMVGEVPDFDLTELLPSPKAYLDRQTMLLLGAAALARQAGKLVPESFPPEQTGLSMGAAWGAAETLDLFFADYLAKGPRLVKPILFPQSYANAAISMLAMEWEARGPHLNFVSGADASTQALIAALDILRNGEAEMVMAGGAEALSAVRWRKRAATSDITIPGEGAAVFLIEREATARARGLIPQARLLGGSFAGGPPGQMEITCASVIRQALEDAGLTSGQLHGVYFTSGAATFCDTPPNVRRFIPEKLYGDVEGASGALQTACALLGAPASLPALIMTSTVAGTAAAVVLGV